MPSGVLADYIRRSVDRRNIVLAVVTVLILGLVVYSCGKDIGPAEGATGALLGLLPFG